MQLVDAMQPRGATRNCTTTNFSPQHRKISGQIFCFHYKVRPLISALGTKILTHQSQFWKNGHSKFQNSQYQLSFFWINGPLFRFLGAFGP